jgi:hypothetical protein
MKSADLASPPTRMELATSLVVRRSTQRYEGS